MIFLLFSGHGFNDAPVVGKILSELALGGPLSYDLSPFRIGRFGLSKTTDSVNKD